MRRTSREGKPCTIICMTHGRLRCVLRAPCVSSPLCCLRWRCETRKGAERGVNGYLMRRGGDGVLPMYTLDSLACGPFDDARRRGPTWWTAGSGRT